MKRFQKIYFILIFVVLGCNERKKIVDPKVKAIEIAHDDEHLLSGFIDKIEYISLPDNLYFGFIDKVIECNGYMAFCDYENGYQITVLDKGFQIKSVINNYGEGPGEYQYIKDVTYNNEGDFIEILTQKKIIRFDLNGNFVEEFKLPFTIDKFQYYQGDEYMVYIPSGYNKKFITEDLEGGILFIWDIESNSVSELLPNYYKFPAPLATERSNLIKFNNEFLFSFNFSDTIYHFHSDSLNVKYFLDLKGKNLPMDVLKDRNIVDVLNNESVRQRYIYQQPNLLASEKFLITRFVENGLFKTLVYNRKNGSVISGGEFNNDIDNGIEYFNPRLVLGKTILTIHQPEELINKFETNSEEGREMGKDFHDLASSLDINSPQILCLYHMK